MTRERVIGLIAGSGHFPVEIATDIASTGQQLQIFCLRGFYDRRLRAFPHVVIDMLDPQGSIHAMRSRNVSDVILAGGVQRPGLSSLLSIYSAFKHRDELQKLMKSGDDTLLRGVVSFLEENGFRVLGVDAVAPSCLAPIGSMAASEMPSHFHPIIERAIALLSDLGRYDVGQGVVVAANRVLAIEGPEGTDAMLARVADMQSKKRVRLGDDRAILVKIAKPGQDRRVDLPAIGPKTVRAAYKAGLSGIAVAAGDVVLVERDALLRDADRVRLFITGVKAS
jgi:DUF1009 family protein